MAAFDCIVLGTGGIGSAALYHLARRGSRVLGLDRFVGPHDRGSSHGHTRVIRLAYFEHPSYVPLLRRAYDLWAELAETAKRELYRETGVLQVGPENGAVIGGLERCAAEHDLEIERVDAIERRFRGLRVADGNRALFEARAGYLHVEDCVRAHLTAARDAGATIEAPVRVEGWRREGGGVVVETSVGTFEAARLVITPGAWAPSLLGDIGSQLHVRRKSVFWYEGGDAYAVDRFPIFLIETPDGIFYGFPKIDARGIKLGEHTGGRPVSDPLAVDRAIVPDDKARVERFAASHLPGVTTKLIDHSVCMYTMSPDEHFVVGLHPDAREVAFAAGLSGHGFKFAPVLGEILADLTLDGRTAHPIELFSPLRAALHPA